MLSIITNYFPNLTPTQIEQFKQLQGLYEHWNAQINVISRKDIESLYEKHVLHSLGIAKVMEFKPNTKIMDVTFDLLHTHKKPFIFASSQMSTMSFSSYGRSKALGESYTKILNGLTVKFWNVYGIEYDLEKSHVITDLIIKAKKTGKVDLLTDGTEERQFLYADDCCEALLTLSENYEVIPRDEELHVTSFEWNNVLTVAKIISDHFPGSEVVPAESAKDEVQKDVKNEPNTIIQKYWQPKTSLEEGISRVIEEMNKHPELFFK